LTIASLKMSKIASAWAGYVHLMNCNQASCSQ
jgi:hypothetical protein